MGVKSLFSPIASAILVASVGAFLSVLSVLDLLGDRSSFVGLTMLLLIYLLVEVSRLRRLHPDRWLFNPVVLCSLVTFVLGYGVTNAIFFVPEDQLELLGLIPEVSPAMVKLMWLVLLGAVAMWMGYWSPIAASLARPAVVARFQARFLPKTNSLRPAALPLLVSITIGARLLQIELGVFGYSSTYDRLIEMGSITQYLAMGAGLGKLALVLAAFQYYAHRNSYKAKQWFYGLLVVEVLFGFLSGFKSAVVMPFVIVAICQYLRTGKFSKHWLILMVVGVVVAYAVIEPFRAAHNAGAAFQNTSAVGIASTMVGSVGTSAEFAAEKAPLLVSIASRSNLSYIGSFGIAYSDEHSFMPAGSPEFLADIFLAPLHAWIPRLLWEGKPLGNLGLWYNQVVMGMEHFSSTAMGPFAYLYFAGGYVAVFLGFFFIGIVQRGLFFLLQPGVSAPGGVIFLVMLATVSVIDSAFNGILIALFRELPLAILLQFVLFRSRVGRGRVVAFSLDDSGKALPTFSRLTQS